MECDKCDLYMEEDEKDILKRAREQAEKEWWQGEGKGLSEDDMRRTGVLKEGALWDLRAWEGWLDGTVERFVVVKVD